jgi:hypothetical protein
MSSLEIIWRDDPLLQDANARDILTVVMQVFLCKDMSEKG